MGVESKDKEIQAADVNAVAGLENFEAQLSALDCLDFLCTPTLTILERTQAALNATNTAIFGSQTSVAATKTASAQPTQTATATATATQTPTVSPTPVTPVGAGVPSSADQPASVPDPAEKDFCGNPISADQRAVTGTFDISASKVDALTAVMLEWDLEANADFIFSLELKKDPPSIEEPTGPEDVAKDVKSDTGSRLFMPMTTTTYTLIAYFDDGGPTICEKTVTVGSGGETTTSDPTNTDPNLGPVACSKPGEWSKCGGNPSTEEHPGVVCHGEFDVSNCVGPEGNSFWQTCVEDLPTCDPNYTEAPADDGGGDPPVICTPGTKTGVCEGSIYVSPACAMDEVEECNSDGTAWTCVMDAMCPASP